MMIQKLIISYLIVILYINTSLFSQNFKSLLTDELARVYLKYDKIEIEFLDKSLNDVNADKVEIINSSKTISPIINLVVRIFKNKNYEEKVISLKLKVYDYVVVSYKDIKDGEVINQSNVKIYYQNVVGVTNYFNNIEQINGKLAKGFIPKGTIINDFLIKSNSIIKYNDKVVAFKKYGNVEISFEVTAKNDGDIGEIIRVIDKRGQMFDARVISANQVEIVK